MRPPSRSGSSTIVRRPRFPAASRFPTCAPTPRLTPISSPRGPSLTRPSRSTSTAGFIQLIRIALPRTSHCLENPQPSEYQHADPDPARRHMHQVGSDREPDDEHRVSNQIDCERHSFLSKIRCTSQTNIVYQAIWHKIYLKTRSFCRPERNNYPLCPLMSPPSARDYLAARSNGFKASPPP